VRKSPIFKTSSLPSQGTSCTPFFFSSWVMIPSRPTFFFPSFANRRARLPVSQCFFPFFFFWFPRCPRSLKGGWTIRLFPPLSPSFVFPLSLFSSFPSLFTQDGKERTLRNKRRVIYFFSPSLPPLEIFFLPPFFSFFTPPPLPPVSRKDVSNNNE